jgi:hypothetical protein
MFPDLLSLITDTVTLGWRAHDGWRLWYGAGGTITLLLLVLRVAPAAGRFFRDTQWSTPALLMACLVLTVGPLTALVATALAWPLVIAFLLAGRSRTTS